MTLTARGGHKLLINNGEMQTYNSLRLAFEWRLMIEWYQS